MTAKMYNKLKEQQKAYFTKLESDVLSHDQRSLKQYKSCRFEVKSVTINCCFQEITCRTPLINQVNKSILLSSNRP